MLQASYSVCLAQDMPPLVSSRSMAARRLHQPSACTNVTCGCSCSDTQLVPGKDGAGHGWDIKGDPTEGALVVAAAKAGLSKDITRRRISAHAGNPVFIRNKAYDNPAPNRRQPNRLRQGRP